MAVGTASATGRTSHYYVGAEKRNLDILDELKSVASSAIKSTIATPTSGILNTVRNSMSNGNEQDSSSLTMSSTIGCIGTFGILEKYGAQVNATNALIQNFHSNPAIMSDFAITHNAFHDRKNDLSSNITANGLTNTLSNRSAMNLYFSNSLPSGNLNINNTSDYYNFRNEIIKISNDRGLGDVIKNGQQILDRQNDLLKDANSELSKLTAGGKKTVFTKLEQDKIDKLRNSIKNINENISICKSGMQFKSVEDKYKPSSKKITGLGVGVGIGIGIFNSTLRNASDTASYKGYQTLRQYWNYGKVTVKLAWRELKASYKFIGRPIITNVGGRSLRFVANKLSASHQTISNFINSSLTRIGNSEKDIGFAINILSNKEARGHAVRTAKNVVTSAARNGVRLVGRGAANLLSRTGVGKRVVGGARIIGRVANKGLGVLSIPFKFVGGVVTRMARLMSTIKSLVDPKELMKKIWDKIKNKITLEAIKSLFFLIVANIIPTAFIVIILVVFTHLATIVDAISSTYEKFVSETTMGATYAKLLDKERDFAAQVSSLTEEKIPDGIGHDIKEWTNYKVHFIGADGKEMSNSLESTGGSVMIGNGNSNGEIGSLRNEASDRIWTYMKQNGWTDQATAALMGNIYNECSMNYRANGKQDIGIVQWTDNSKGARRKTQYIQWATSNGYDPLDLEAQLKYLFKEPHHGDTVRAMAHMTSLEDATWYFISRYEMYNNYKTDIKEKNERTSAARDYYNYYTTHEPFNNIEADESLIASNAGSASDTNISSGNFETIASNYNVNTIKGILTMAYIYIDRDFKKYGSLTDKLWGDSVYKDYCAKLYDSTHIIALNKDTPKVYYCPNYQADENGSDDQVVDYPEATDSCNNFIPSGQTESTDSSITRPTVITYTVAKATYEVEKTDPTRPNDSPRTEYVEYLKYTIYGTGAYGTVTFSYDKQAKNGFHDAYEGALSELKARGGKSFLSYCIDETQYDKTFVLVSNDPVCKGHIDGEAFVFVSNIYDPSNEKDPAKAQTSVQEDNSADGVTTENQTGLAKPNDNEINNSVRMIAKSNTNKSGFQINAFAAPNDDDYDDSEDTDTEPNEEEDDNVDDDELINFRQTGWQNIRGNWYYIDELSHDKIVNKRKIIKGKDGLNYYYFFDGSGKMYTGFQIFVDDDETEFKRYFGSDGAMKFGWQEIDGKWYYFSEKNGNGHRYGQMYVNEKTPDGYEVGEDGVWKDKKETQTNTSENNTGGNGSGNANSSGNNGSNGNGGGSGNSGTSTGGNGTSDYDKQKEEKQRNSQNEKKPYSYIGYNYIDKKQAESRYSMYALDKYATAFNDPNKPTEIEEEEIDPDNPQIKTKKTIKVNGRVGDEESVNEANQYSDSHAGEKFVMDDLVKKYYESKGINKEPNLEIKNWWNNESWFTNLSTTKTYYRIYNDDTKNIDSLGNKSNNPNDKNVVNTSNSKPFWFNAFTSESGRNENFEKHGWDDSSIQQVRLILADNWEERYGVVIQNTMNVTPLSDAEIAAILQNENLDGLSDKRKSILATVIKFQKNVAEPFNTKYIWGTGHGRLKTIDQITVNDTFDCSSYASTIYYNAGIDNKMRSTADYRSLYKKYPMSDLKPGDLIVTPKHVVIYLGNGLISHASTRKLPLKTTYRVDGTKYFKEGYVYRPNGLD